MVEIRDRLKKIENQLGEVTASIGGENTKPATHFPHPISPRDERYVDARLPSTGKPFRDREPSGTLTGASPSHNHLHYNPVARRPQKPLALTILTTMATRSNNPAEYQVTPGREAGPDASVSIESSFIEVPFINEWHFSSCLKAEFDQGRTLSEKTNGSVRHELPGFPEIDESVSSRLSQSYFARVNTWFPVIDECYTWVEHFSQAESSAFREDSLSVALVLLVFALGNLAEEGTRPATDLDSLLGSRLFYRAFNILVRNSFRTDLTVIQCYILATYVLSVPGFSANFLVINHAMLKFPNIQTIFHVCDETSSRS